MRSIPEIQAELLQRSGSANAPVKAVPVPVSISIPPYQDIPLSQLRDLSSKATDWLRTHQDHPQYEAASIRHRYLCKVLADRVFDGS